MFIIQQLMFQNVGEREGICVFIEYIQTNSMSLFIDTPLRFISLSNNILTLAVGFQCIEADRFLQFSNVKFGETVSDKYDVELDTWAMLELCKNGITQFNAVSCLLQTGSHDLRPARKSAYARPTARHLWAPGYFL
jgi:hypothetical protein